MPNMITKEVIREATRLCSTKPSPILKLVKNEVVMELIGAQYDRRALTIKDITNPRMKYVAMMIGYKIYFSNRENSVSAIAINMSCKMVVNGADFDLCELLRAQLIENLQKKKDSKYPFKYEILIICLFFYFLRQLPSTKSVVWLKGRPIAHQIKDLLRGIGDVETHEESLLGFFKMFQKNAGKGKDSLEDGGEIRE